MADGPAALEQKLMVTWGQEGGHLGPGPCLGSSFPGPMLQLTCINYQAYFICTVFFCFSGQAPMSYSDMSAASRVEDFIMKVTDVRRREAGDNYSVFQQHLGTTLRCGIFEQWWCL